MIETVESKDTGGDDATVREAFKATDALLNGLRDEGTNDNYGE